MKLYSIDTTKNLYDPNSADEIKARIALLAPGERAWGRMRTAPRVGNRRREDFSEDRPSHLARCLDNTKRADRSPGFYSSAAALNEVYEVPRQLIDSSPAFAGLLVAVSASPAFLSDEKRGADRYRALRMRIFDDIRRRGRQDVLAPLVRLEAA